MRFSHQIAMEYLSQGLTIPSETAYLLEDAGFDLSLYEGLIDVHGQEDIDPQEVDPFEHIDQNH